MDYSLFYGGCSSAWIEHLTVAQMAAGSNPVTHPSNCNSLCCNELHHITDGRRSSVFFYLATSLGVRALLFLEMCEIIFKHISVDREELFERK